LTAHDLERAAELVDDKRAERLARDVLGDDQEGLLGLHHLLEEGDELGDAVDLVLVDEDEALSSSTFMRRRSVTKLGER
jgi:hypothetical protein